MPKSWHEKLHVNYSVKIETLEKPFAGAPAGSTMLVVNPLVIKKTIDGIPEGKRMTLVEIRQKLARKHKADMMCPLTSGIFLRIVAEAAWDEILAGKKPEEVTPFWRAISAKDPVVKKLRCGLEFLEERWKAEGIGGDSPGHEGLLRVRRICSALPGVTEKLSHGAPTFYLKKAAFAMFANNLYEDGHVAVWVPAAPGEQEALVRGDPKAFYRPPYLGVKGWVGIELDQVDDDELGAHVSEAWRLINSKKK